MNYDTTAGANGAFWLTLCFINAGLAETKGRSRLRWFIASLFIGPIATALIVVWPRPSERRLLHPVSNVKDRLLVIASVLLAVFVVAVIALIVEVAGLVFTGSSPDDIGFVVASIAVAAVSAVGFFFAMRAYNRRIDDASDRLATGA